jgi:hypothetical protein
MTAPAEPTYDEFLASVERTRLETTYQALIEEVERDPGFPFRESSLKWLAETRRTDPAHYHAVRGHFARAGINVRDLDDAVASFARNGAVGSSANSPLAYTLLRDLKPSLRSNQVVRDLIPRRAFGEVHADAGGGKTAIMVDLLLHVAAGFEYRGRRVEKQPVVFVALEGHGGIVNRVIAAAAEIGITRAPFALVKAGGSFRDPAAAQQVGTIATELARQFGGDNPVVAIDTYTAALGSDGSDCDPRDVSSFIANVQKLLAACTVIILHHFGKDSSRGGRGWSGLRAALDFELEIDHDGDLRTMRVTKSRDGSDQQPACCYRLVGREIGVNEHGEPVTAVVVEHLDDEDTARRGKRYSPKARAASNLLWQMIKDREQSFPLPDHPGLRCVILADWEKACTAPGAICNCKEERDRRLRFNAACKELIEAQTITVDNGRVYRTPKPNATPATERDEDAG